MSVDFSESFVEFIRTAPSRIYLQISDEKGDMPEDFSLCSREDITWHDDSCVVLEVPYIRADTVAAESDVAELAGLIHDAAHALNYYSDIIGTDRCNGLIRQLREAHAKHTAPPAGVEDGR